MGLCPKYGFEITEAFKKSYCLNCSENCGIRSRFEPLGKVDMFKLGRLLAEKEKQKKVE